MKSILILIIVGLIRFSEGSQNVEMCHSDNGRLLLISDVKILGNITTKSTTTFYVSKTNELEFGCYKNHEVGMSGNLGFDYCLTFVCFGN